MNTFLLVINILVSAGIVAVVLMQRSEGGALGIGGGPGGMMSGRGAANLLTRTTMVLAALFFIVAIASAFYAGTRVAEDRLAQDPVFEEEDAPLFPDISDEPQEDDGR